MIKITLTKKEICQGNLILVNQDHPIHHDFHKNLVQVKSSYAQVFLHPAAAKMLEKILKDINGVQSIIPISGYRTKKEQENIFQTSLKENSADFTKKYVAYPNHSEHQTGLAIDVGLKKEKIDFICPDFPYTGICEKFRRQAANYGFIQRYTKEKESITKIAHEPWHFRYVGYPHSKIIENKQLSLEEYIEVVKHYTYNNQHLEMRDEHFYIEIFYIPLTDKEEIQITLPSCSAYQISGNNIDGFIAAIWQHR